MPSGALRANSSYTFNIKVKSKDQLLLFNDGTVGYYGDNGTRTPIAVVIKEKTGTEDGTAVTLKDCINQGERRSLSMVHILLLAIGYLQRTILQTILIWPPRSMMLMATSGHGRLRGRKKGQ